MKFRPSIWMILVLAVAVTAVVVWHHRPAPSLVREKTKIEPTFTTPKPIVHAPLAKRATPQPPAMAVANPVVQLSPAVQVIVNEQAGYQQRADGIQALTGKLTDPDMDALYNFLRQHSSADDQQLGQVLKNQLMDALCQIQPPFPGLGDLLTQVYQDQGQNTVLRDYAVQHLAEFYRQTAGATDMDAQMRNDELKQTQNVLWEALNDTDSSIAGTALLGLSHLSQEGWSGFDQSKIGDVALKLAGDNNAGELTHITAIQVCGNLGVQGALSMILAAAQHGETIPVQISAIGALGALGGADQERFLNSLLQGNDDRLKPAAQQALIKIEARQRLAQLQK